MRLIDADELHKKSMRIINGNASNEAWAIAYAITGAETVEAEPVKHGKWQKAYIGMNNNGGIYLGDTEHTGYLCSVCGNFAYPYIKEKLIAKYCFECGAKMEEKYEY